jgi:hypothetical protein
MPFALAHPWLFSILYLATLYVLVHVTEHLSTAIRRK